MTTFTLTNYADYVDNTNTYYGDHGNHTWYALKGEDTVKSCSSRSRLRARALRTRQPLFTNFPRRWASRDVRYSWP